MGSIISKICIALYIASLLTVTYIDRGDVWNLKREKLFCFRNQEETKCLAGPWGATSV